MPLPTRLGVLLQPFVHHYSRAWSCELKIACLRTPPHTRTHMHRWTELQASVPQSASSLGLHALGLDIASISVDGQPAQWQLRPPPARGLTKGAPTAKDVGEQVWTGVPVCIHMCVCVGAPVCACAPACVHGYFCAKAYVCACVCQCACVWVHLCACVCVLACVFACVCTYVCVRMCVHACMCPCACLLVCAHVCAHVCAFSLVCARVGAHAYTLSNVRGHPRGACCVQQS